MLVLLPLLACTSGAPGGADDSSGSGDSDAPSVPRAVELFGPSPYPGLTLRLHHRQGAQPDPGALDALRGALADLAASGHLVKPGGVTVELGSELPAGTGAAYTFDELDADLEAARGDFVQDGSAVIHGLYTDGSYDNGGEGTVLGFAYGRARLVMMKEVIDTSCHNATVGLPGGLGGDACVTYEAAVLLHELGHLFGLVDNGIAMVSDHKDAEHGAHDVDSGCLMYWAAETPDFAGTVATRFLGGDTSLPSFDQACLDDMAAALD